MVIQRFQTLFLVVAFALAAAFVFMPFGYSVIEENGVPQLVQEWTAYEFVGLVIPAAVASLLYLISIFFYQRMALQKTIVWLGVIATLAAIGVTVYILASGFLDATIGDVITRTKWGGSGLLLVGAALAGLLAISRISADQRLLRSADRLR